MPDTVSNIPALPPGKGKATVLYSGFGSDPDFDEIVQYVVVEKDAAGQMVREITQLVPDLDQWRLTISGDFASSVEQLRGQQAGTYSTARGAGRAVAATIPQDDGTFDIVINAEALVTFDDSHTTAEMMLDHAMTAARHFGRHEAGHAVLAIRGESDQDYRELTSGLTATQLGWTDVVAAHLDDHRIERHTHAQAPSPFSQMDGMAGAIEHLRAELNAAKQQWPADLPAAGLRSGRAVSSMLRVLAYLAAELGVDADGVAVRPEPAPLGWDEYVEPFWDRWSAAFHRATPADEAMSPTEIASVLADLCALTVDWCQAIGYVAGVDNLGRVFHFWTRDYY